MLDPCSQGSVIHESVLASLSPNKMLSTAVTVKTVSRERKMNSTAVQGVVATCTDEFGDIYRRVYIILPTYSQDELPSGPHDLPTRKKIARWNYLTQIARCMPEDDREIPFALLIGGNRVKALEPCEVMPSQSDGPYTVRTHLVWHLG